MTDSNVFSIELSELLSTVENSYSDTDGWAEIIEMFNSDPDDRKRVDDLILDYRENGSWRNPVKIVSGTNENEQYLSNGTHRVVAALEMGLDSILAEYDTFDEELNGGVIAFPVKIFSNTQLTEDEWIDVITYTRSLRIDGDNWATTDLSLVSRDISSFAYYADELPDMTPQSLREFLEASLNERFSGDFTVLVDEKRDSDFLEF